ncbi:MAG: elongation factor 1-alpha C-terminal domain-related protein, partial [Alsobacter sp.]
RFRGRLLWMSQNPPDPANILLRVHNVTAPATLTIRDRVDIETYERHSAETLPLNGIGHVSITADRPLVIDSYGSGRDLGAFILMDRVTDETVALGVIDAVEAEPAAREIAAGQEVPLRARVLRLLAPEPPASADRLAEAVVWRLGISALFGLIVMVFTGSLSMGLAAGFADAVARTLLRAALRDVLAQIRLRRGDVHIDGSGI